MDGATAEFPSDFLYERQEECARSAETAEAHASSSPPNGDMTAGTSGSKRCACEMAHFVAVANVSKKPPAAA